MRESIKLALVLGLMCSICGALVVFVGERTEFRRASAADARRLAAARSVLPPFDPALAKTIDVKDHGATLLVNRGDGRFLGAALEGVSNNGYGGEMRLMVGFDADGRVVDFAPVALLETPGLGTKIATEGFRASFRGRSVSGSWKITKDGGEIDAVTSATISSRAAVEAVGNASSRFVDMRDAGVFEAQGRKL